MKRGTRPTPLFLLSIGMISAATLAYEIVLMRLFSIIQWHHFAYMVISLALLGYGASGTLITLFSARIDRWFATLFISSAWLFGVTAVGCFFAAQQLAFNPLELLWDGRQWLRLMAQYSLLLLPFLFAANCICLSLFRFREQLNKVYAVDLLGAGLGAVGAIGLLKWVFPLVALSVVSCSVLLATIVAWFGLRMRSRWPVPFFILSGALVLGANSVSDLRPVEYKGLSQTLNTLGTRVIEERSSPLGLLSVVESPELPFRHVPGMSLNAVVDLPEQLGVFTDGDSMTAISRYSGKNEDLAYLDQVPSALAYRLLDRPRVLVLGAGGGADVLQALYHQASHVDAVEVNPQMVDLLDGGYAGFAGRIYDHPKVAVHIADARGFVNVSDQRYDLIQLGLLDAFNTSSAGLYALNETYIYTVEAIRSYLEHLTPEGMLSITRWVRLPPRGGVKLFATAVEAMRQMGFEQPGRHLIWIRAWNTSALLVKERPFTQDQIATLRAFCESRWFDLAYFPGIRAGDTNRYNVLDEPFFFQAAAALLGDQRESYIHNYKFDVAPTTDDRPYFFHFFRWSALSEFLKLRGAGGISLLDMGYVVLVATLFLVAIMSLFLIVLPLGFMRSGEGREANSRFIRWRVFVYFFCVGAAFMFVEIAFIQKFILYLSYPLYAIAVVLTGFLIFAGLGSASIPVFNALARTRTTVLAVAAIASICLLYSSLLPPIFDHTASASDEVRIAISLVLIAPLAFFMGMPFALGMSGLAASSSGLIPWAWGINGCASVIGAVVATLLGIHLGITAVVFIAVIMYVLAVCFRPQ